MFKFGDVFENRIYDQMSKEFNFTPLPSPQQSIHEIEQDILSNSINLPQQINQQILNLISQLKNIFEIINPNFTIKPYTPLQPKNIFNLISRLSNLISELNFPSPKGAIKILYEKSIQIANKIIKIICSHFQNYSVKIFKYM